MFETQRLRTRRSAAANILELIYHTIVRNIRKTHENALIGLMMNMLQAVMFVAAFYVMFTLLGLRGMAIRGDFLVYIMSGIFLFLTHTKTMSAVVSSEGPASPMMKHAPMNTIISILGAAFAQLYLQTLTAIVVLLCYSAIVEPVHLDRPLATYGMFLIAWGTGAAVGLVFLAIKPWAPAVVNVLSSLYARANMIASGKMFVANQLPPLMLAMFDWNPLFHAIDQARGFAFINYSPRNSSIDYPIYVALVLVMIGLMLEFYTRKNASESWGARA
ncbi:MAG: ABC transporter permease [Pseudomonadota bacterium]